MLYFLSGWSISRESTLTTFFYTTDPRGAGIQVIIKWIQYAIVIIYRRQPRSMVSMSIVSKHSRKLYQGAPNVLWKSAHLYCCRFEDDQGQKLIIVIIDQILIFILTLYTKYLILIPDIAMEIDNLYPILLAIPYIDIDSRYCQASTRLGFDLGWGSLSLRMKWNKQMLSDIRQP